MTAPEKDWIEEGRKHFLASKTHPERPCSNYPTQDVHLPKDETDFIAGFNSAKGEWERGEGLNGLSAYMLEMEESGRVKLVPTSRAEGWPMGGGIATTLLKQRDARESILPNLREPSWTMLLILGDAEERQRKLIISNVCDGCHAPYGTALRHLGILERRGLVEREKDDGRSSFIRLTILAREKLEALADRLAA